LKIFLVFEAITSDHLRKEFFSGLGVLYFGRKEVLHGIAIAHRGRVGVLGKGKA
jgi:hypothetical protein